MTMLSYNFCLRYVQIVFYTDRANFEYFNIKSSHRIDCYCQFKNMLDAIFVKKKNKRLIMD